MKKLIASLMAMAVLTWVAGPLMVVANGSVSTGLNRGTGGGTAPIVMAKWEMSGHCMSGNQYVCTSANEGEDDSTNAGAQFMPSGQWGVDMNYTVCAIVTDPDGVSDIQGVYADIYWPAGIAFHANPTYPDVHLDPYAFTSQSGANDIGLEGCGAFKEQNTLYPLSKTDGYRLFCDSIQDNNTNLPAIFSSYSYQSLCAADGDLMKETAKVYCDNKHLIWEDPAGEYKAEIMAQDKTGNSSIRGLNYFTYLEMMGFEKDFSNVSYGTVMLNTHKSIAGDLNFGTADRPTIRNTGNVRLSMWIAQDDMGLGQSSSVWNVQYDARVGNHEADWKDFNPFGYKGATPAWDTNYVQLEDVLDLSEVEEMDFSILVKKWPNDNTSYSGSTWLGAKKAPARVCPQISN